MTDQKRANADYDSTPADDQKPRQAPVTGTIEGATGEDAAAGGDDETEPGVRDQEASARPPAGQGGYP